MNFALKVAYVALLWAAMIVLTALAIDGAKWAENVVTFWAATVGSLGILVYGTATFIPEEVYVRHYEKRGPKERMPLWFYGVDAILGFVLGAVFASQGWFVIATITVLESMLEYVYRIRDDQAGRATA